MINTVGCCLFCPISRLCKLFGTNKPGIVTVVPESGGNSEFPVNMHQKEQLRESVVSMMQSQHLPVSSSSPASCSLGHQLRKVSVF